jgi:hypothetical protein
VNQPLIKKHKWFWAWQDEQEERWLREIARHGLHLQKADAFGKYTFVKGAPQDVAYRLDFVPSSKKQEDYFQLFRDAGWEHVGEMMGWQYWRKEIVDSKVPEIFTDKASKIQKYQRLLAFSGMFYPIFVVFLSNYSRWSAMQDSSFLGAIYEIAFFLFFMIVMLNLVNMLMILRRITRLKRK